MEAVQPIIDCLKAPITLAMIGSMAIGLIRSFVNNHRSAHVTHRPLQTIGRDVRIRIPRSSK